MQLIRHMLEVTEHMQIATIVYKHKEYFDRAADSVLKSHNIESEYKDMFDAAEVIYKSMEAERVNNLYLLIIKYLKCFSIFVVSIRNERHFWRGNQKDIERKIFIA